MQSFQMKSYAKLSDEKLMLYVHTVVHSFFTTQPSNVLCSVNLIHMILHLPGR